MSLANLSSAQLGLLIQLVKEKEQLQTRLSRINSEIESLNTDRSVANRRGRSQGSGKRSVDHPIPTAQPRRRRKRLKRGILKALQAAGAKGITVKEIAAKVKVKPNNVFSWFYATGKKVKGLQKIGEGRYSWQPE